MTIAPELVAEAVYEGIRTCAVTLRPDCHAAISTALAQASSSVAQASSSVAQASSSVAQASSSVAQARARSAEACGASSAPAEEAERSRESANTPSNSREASILEDILENAAIATRDDVPLCQDTGSVWVCLEAGTEGELPGNVFSQVNDAVARAYVDGGLRMSIVEDALFNRTNTHTNTPAFCEVRFAPGRACKLYVMLKGGGSDNASRLVMLAPGAGREGVKRVVLDAVREKAANACPPLVVGVGVGATFDKVAGLSKHALLRPVGSPAATEEAAAFERELLAEINATGIGPGALGGACTALAVHLETAPCHIAALPVAVNMGCCAMRSASYLLVDDDGQTLEHPEMLQEEVAR